MSERPHYQKRIISDPIWACEAGVVRLREMEEADQALVLAWRSDREVMRYLPNAPVHPTFKSQWEYFKGPALREWHRYWVVTLHDELAPRPVGVCQFHADTGEVGLLIGEKSLWGKGVGGSALGMLMGKVAAYMWGDQPPANAPSAWVWACIHRENEASQRLFETWGFVPTDEEARCNQLTYRWEVTT